jgi:hypothetical protein
MLCTFQEGLADPNETVRVVEATWGKILDEALLYAVISFVWNMKYEVQ